ncbi:unnamed protein product [Amoebophrya sp. A120]|nr:unnamed protein product [Amoebophrya sp. A120]|eukprot:GSA120T00013637001.1
MACNCNCGWVHFAMFWSACFMLQRFILMAMDTSDQAKSMRGEVLTVRIIAMLCMAVVVVLQMLTVFCNKNGKWGLYTCIACLAGVFILDGLIARTVDSGLGDYVVGPHQDLTNVKTYFFVLTYWPGNLLVTLLALYYDGGDLKPRTNADWPWEGV